MIIVTLRPAINTIPRMPGAKARQAVLLPKISLQHDKTDHENRERQHDDGEDDF
jgi:hypothetical protein